MTVPVGSVHAMELEWAEPPKEAFAVVPGGMYGDMAKELRKSEGKWAIVPREFASEDSAKNTATRIRQGRVAAMPKGEFEAVSHEAKVYVRFVAPQEEEQQSGPRLVQPARQRTRNTPESQQVNQQIRAWAKAQGMEVSEFGRLPKEVTDAYHEAMDREEHGGEG